MIEQSGKESIAMHKCRWRNVLDCRFGSYESHSLFENLRLFSHVTLCFIKLCCDVLLPVKHLWARERFNDYGVMLFAKTCVHARDDAIKVVMICDAMDCEVVLKVYHLCARKWWHRDAM